jgi:hypothetical protein
MLLISNLQGGHCFARSGRGISQVEKSPPLNWETQILMVAYDKACSPNVCRNGVNFLQRIALQEKEKLMTACVSMLLKLRTSPDMLPFSLCNKKTCNSAHEENSSFQLYRFRPTTSASRSGYGIISTPSNMHTTFHIFFIVLPMIMLVMFGEQ